MARDFVGFTFNGHHSSEFNILRVSDGSRYNENLLATNSDKTADVPGGDGNFLFNSYFKQRKFVINFAFDSVTEADIRKMRNWLSGRTTSDLIFDERPYKVWSAKVTNTPTIKTICFLEGDQRVYKGEGSFELTCYYPYAHNVNGKKSLADYTNANKAEWSTSSGMPAAKGNIALGANYGDIPTPFVVALDSVAANTVIQVENNTIIVQEAVSSSFTWDSKTGLVTGKRTSGGEVEPIKYIGNSVGALSVGTAAKVCKVGSTDLVNDSTLKYNFWYL